MLAQGHKSIYQALGRHAVHPFPARMAPEIALDLLKQAKGPMRVLDPMMGSGTVVALARANKHIGYGVDIDPLAHIIASVWTTAVDAARVRKSAKRAMNCALANFDKLPLRDAYPFGASKASRQFVRYWFDGQARRQLAALSRAIKATRNECIRSVLWCAFSRLIIAKQDGASLALDLAHSRPHRHFKTAPVKPFDRFLGSVEFVLKNVISKGARGAGPCAVIRSGDARRLRLKAASIDLVLTSPPYLNAIDYIRCSKFSLVWMGHNVDDLTNIRKRSIGTEVGRELGSDKEIASVIKAIKIAGLPARYRAIVASYVDDMRSALREAFRVLVPGGSAVYVIGENTVAGTYIRNAKILALLARGLGFKLRYETRRVLPPNRRYLPPPKRKRSAALDARMRTEVVLSFRKPKHRSA